MIFEELVNHKNQEDKVIEFIRPESDLVHNLVFI